jgi:DNA invertase Pin-like site-specific DNA recombinase
MSGEGGIRAPYFSLLASPVHLTPQPLGKQAFAFLWTFVVIAGCLGLLGINLSTISAQSTRRPDHWLVAGLLGSSGRTCCSRRGSRRGRCSLNGAELPCASYSRYSSDYQSEASITDQQRRCREAAEREGLKIAPEYEFSDAAVSGTKREREGLNAMLQAAQERQFGCLFFFNISRLARESVITMPMLKELVYVHKIRVISVTEGIDSHRDGWELIASIVSVMAERYIKDLSISVFRGQEGAVLAGFAVGDHCFGYRSIPVPGSEENRRGRNAKPRKIYVKDDVNASWVIRIFHWFVREKRGIRWIAQELNRLGAPKDHRATTASWRHQYVTELLSRKKYIGIWPWGECKNERNPLNGDLRQEPRAEEETEKWTRHFPELRLIDDDTWNAAQQRLQKNRDTHKHRHNADGTLKGSSPADAANYPRRLLSGLVKCVCGANFIVGGRNGCYLICPRYAQGRCQCKSQLHRERAEKLILDVVSRCILSSEDWKKALLDETIASWNELNLQIPDETRQLEKQLSEVNRKIKVLVDAVEAEDNSDIRQRLRDRQSERQLLERQLRSIEQAPAKPTQPPTMEWLEQQLQNLADVMRDSTPAATFALRKLVGGAIHVREIREDGRKRFRLEGTVRVAMNDVIDALDISWLQRSKPTEMEGDTEMAIAPKVPLPDDANAVEYVIDFQSPPPIAIQAEKAKALADQGLQNKQIAARLGCTPSRVTTILQYWHKVHGLSAPDGRARRATTEATTETSLKEEQVDEAKRLWDDGLADIQIAVRLGWKPSVAAEAVSRWFHSRNQAQPNHVARRQALADQMVALYDSDVEINEIGRRLLRPLAASRMAQDCWRAAFR